MTFFGLRSLKILSYRGFNSQYIIYVIIKVAEAY